MSQFIYLIFFSCIMVIPQNDTFLYYKQNQMSLCYLVLQIASSLQFGIIGSLENDANKTFVQ